jgi:hypothetical protein
MSTPPSSNCTPPICAASLSNLFLRVVVEIPPPPIRPADSCTAANTSASLSALTGTSLFFNLAKPQNCSFSTAIIPPPPPRPGVVSFCVASPGAVTAPSLPFAAVRDLAGELRPSSLTFPGGGGRLALVAIPPPLSLQALLEFPAPLGLSAIFRIFSTAGALLTEIQFVSIFDASMLLHPCANESVTCLVTSNSTLLAYTPPLLDPNYATAIAASALASNSSIFRVFAPGCGTPSRAASNVIAGLKFTVVILRQG